MRTHKINILKWSLLLFSLIAGFAKATTNLDAIFEFSPKNLTIEFGQRQSLAEIDSDQGLRFFVWNVHKVEDPNLVRDFYNLSEKTTFVLFQEMIDTPEVTNAVVHRRPNFEWLMVRAWTSYLGSDSGTATGVATGSTIHATHNQPLLSTVTEPISETPKSALFSYFKIKNRQEELLIVNIHAINFVFLETFSTHMNQIFSEISKHKGPVVLAGDFNTWNSDRLELLRAQCRQNQLTELPIPTPPTFFALDHAFVRGLEPTYIFDLGSVETSDHAPLLFDLKLKDE